MRVDTSPAGPKSFNVTATDSDNAKASKTVTYNVYDKPTAHINGPAVNTVVNPGGAAPTFLGNCAGGVPAVICTMTLKAPNGTTTTVASGDTLPITAFGSWKRARPRYSDCSPSILARTSQPAQPRAWQESRATKLTGSWTN